jgi:hypothetical protein
MKGRYFVAIAVIVFLLFVGTRGYLLLCPRKYWSVEGGLRDGDGKISLKMRGKAFWPQQVKAFIALGGKRGETCTVTTVREHLWEPYF